MNAVAGHSALVDALIRFAASQLLYLIALLVGGLIVWELRRNREHALRVVLSAGLASALTVAALTGAASIDHETRPFVADDDTVQLLSHAADNSFPSEHAAGALALALIGALAWSRGRYAFLAAGLAVGVARVAGGLHYPGDVLVGWAIGAISAWAGWMIGRLAVERAARMRSRPSIPTS
jgi:membrane-associated phospholipid phosphatase